MSEGWNGWILTPSKRGICACFKMLFSESWNLRSCRYQLRWCRCGVDWAAFSWVVLCYVVWPRTEDSVVQLTEDCDHSVDKLGTHMKPLFGPTWREVLCEEARVGDPGSPVILVLCSSAIRCVELLRWGIVILLSNCCCGDFSAISLLYELLGWVM
jgi:hypothetical protein